MKSKIKNSTLKAIINRLVRIPKRVAKTTLKTGVVTLRQCYNNKQIIEVFADIDNRFLNKI